MSRALNAQQKVALLNFINERVRPNEDSSPTDYQSYTEKVVGYIHGFIKGSDSSYGVVALPVDENSSQEYAATFGAGAFDSHLLSDKVEDEDE